MVLLCYKSLEANEVLTSDAPRSNTNTTLTGMDAYKANKRRVSEARRAFREVARAAAANTKSFSDYDAFAGAVNAQIALDRTAIDTTAVAS